MCFTERRENLAGLRLRLSAADVGEHIAKRLHTQTTNQYGVNSDGTTTV